jgi:general secretion pathway protein G
LTFGQHECGLGLEKKRSHYSRAGQVPTARPDTAQTLRGEKTAANVNGNGFTLIEILVVIVVLAVLATLVAPSVFQHVGTAKDTAARSQIEMMGAALDAYRLDNGAYPTTEQGLEALRILPTMSPPPRNWRGPYLRKAIPMDPWGHPYVYMSPGQVSLDGYDLMSHGSDGQVGGEREARDITSW